MPCRYHRHSKVVVTPRGCVSVIDGEIREVGETVVRSPASVIDGEIREVSEVSAINFTFRERAQSPLALTRGMPKKLEYSVRVGRRSRLSCRVTGAHPTDGLNGERSKRAAEGLRCTSPRWKRVTSQSSSEHDAETSRAFSFSIPGQVIGLSFTAPKSYRPSEMLKATRWSGVH
jgi:hypothetical protein